MSEARGFIICNRTHDKYDPGSKIMLILNYVNINFICIENYRKHKENVQFQNLLTLMECIFTSFIVSNPYF